LFSISRTLTCPKSTGKKDYQNAKRIKKQIVNDGIYEEFWISNVCILFKNIP